MNGIVYATMPAATADQAKVTTAMGLPRCERLNGRVIGSVAPCLCTGDGKGANVHPACPHATRRQTDVVTDSLGRPCLVVDAVMQATPAVVTALPAVLTAVVIALPAPVPIGDAVAEVP